MAQGNVSSVAVQRSRTTNVIVLVSVAYVAAQMIADITSLKIVYVAGFSIDAGTLIYPFTFTLRDMAHKVAGIYTTRVLILAAAAINIVMALFFQIAAVLPGDPAVGPQTEFGLVLAPVWRIVFASIIAEVIAEWIDGEVYQQWVNRMGERHQWMRVLTSNSVSVPVDSLLFVTIAFAGVLPTSVLVSIWVSNVLIKGLVTLISMPWIYLVKA